VALISGAFFIVLPANAGAELNGRTRRSRV
jgi:hypothetical protein